MKARTVIVLIAFLTAFSTCKKKDDKKDKTFPVKIAVVENGHIATTLTVMGSVDSKAHTWANASAEGTIQSLSVMENSRVYEGQILCFIMPPDSMNMLAQAQIEYEKAKRAAKDVESEEGKKLLADAEREYNLAKNLFKRVPVVAPITGTVISKTIENGSNVGLKQPLIEIADLRRLIVKTSVSEDAVLKIRKGQKVGLTFYSNQERKTYGTVAVITPGVSFQTRTASIEIAIPQQSDVKLGMTCAVEFIIAEKHNVPVIPLESIITDIQGNKKVFTVKEDKAIAVPITTGIEENTRVEVTSGLSAGDSIVIMGHENLKNGVKVKIVKPSSEKQADGKEKSEKRIP